MSTVIYTTLSGDIAKDIAHELDVINYRLWWIGAVQVCTVILIVGKVWYTKVYK
jgi:hypothetical protein